MDEICKKTNEKLNYGFYRSLFSSKFVRKLRRNLNIGGAAVFVNKTNLDWLKCQSDEKVCRFMIKNQNEKEARFIYGNLKPFKLTLQFKPRWRFGR